jgi:general secretion pathway protein F
MQYRVKAHDRDGGIRLFAVDALDEVDARRQVQTPGRQIISIARAWGLGFNRATRIALVGFSLELMALLDAGLTLVEAIDTLTEKEPSASARRALEQIRRVCSKVAPCLRAEEQPQVFHRLHATVRASDVPARSARRCRAT